MIGTIAKFLGLDTLIVYAIIAVLAGGGIWAWSAHKYNAGYRAGEIHERAAWEKERDILIRLAEVERKAKQARIDQIEADYQVLQQQAAESQAAQAALEEALRASGADQKPALPKSISKALNGVGR